MPETGNITDLLAQWARGDSGAFDQASSAILPELRRIADSYLRRESSGHTLQPTALVNEAFLRLARERGLQFESRKHFYALAAQLMRRILVDHARAVKAAKRGGRSRTVSLDSLEQFSSDAVEDFLHIHEALEQLKLLSALKARLIELRYFGGLTLEETAEVLEISRSSAHREQRLAEAWLLERLAQ